MKVKTFRGANIDSDYYLVISYITQRLSNVKEVNEHKQNKINNINMDKLGIAENMIYKFEFKCISKY